MCVTLPLALAQSPAPQPAERQPLSSTDSQQPGFTLHTDVRIVLTDVTVTDKAGHLVHGLPASAFHVTLDKDPRPLLSFEEHNIAPTAIAATPVADDNTYSNEFLLHLPPVLNIVVLDTSNLGITQQMYLAYEFNNFLKQLPADQPLAIYGRTGEHLVLVQNFTADHALLKKAADKIMPHLPVAHDPPSDSALLFDLAQQLTQIPGRKNVMWFSGGSGIVSALDPSVFEDPNTLRMVYDQLEAARIAVYPIDARGLPVSTNPVINQQHFQMNDTAQTTGGQAFYGQNFLKNIAQKVLAQDTSFYTLTFSPKDFTPDNKWHKVHITVEPSGYNLSYRQGYFADGNNLAPPIETKPDRHRGLLLTGGKVVDTPANIRSAPIIFTASVDSSPQSSTDAFGNSDFTMLHPPAPPKPGHVAYFVRYMIPSGVFLPQMIDGHLHIAFDIAAIALNQAGENAGENGQRVRLTFMNDNSTTPICVEQQVDLRKGDDYLFLAVWDTATGRLGTIQVPVTVK